MLKQFAYIINSSIVVLMLGFTSTAMAESSKEFGDYVVHYNAFRSDTLTPEIAKTYAALNRGSASPATK